ncbi:MAG: GNAT family acetyltransferase [Burkholderiales bacterium]
MIASGENRAARALPASPIDDLRTVELLAGDAPLLQRFFDANPEYFIVVQGEPAPPGEAREEIEGLPPAGIPHGDKHVFGYVGPDGELAAFANLLADIYVPGVWNMSTFIVSTPRHGTGVAQRINASLEAWAALHGARWMRLGVIVGNVRGERFWRSRGYVETKVRKGYPMGKQLRDVRVMWKSLTGEPLERYLELVPGDRAPS